MIGTRPPVIFSFARIAAVARCQGRIVAGAEISSLQLELETLTRVTKDVILQLEEISFIDSAGLGALVRLFGVLRANGGDLKLCQLSPFLLQVLQVTNLLRIFPIYASETEAIQAFSKGPQFREEIFAEARTRIVCTDTSNDLLAYLSALLKRSGYEAFTTRHPADAMLFVKATRPHATANRSCGKLEVPDRIAQNSRRIIRSL